MSAEGDVKRVRQTTEEIYGPPKSDSSKSSTPVPDDSPSERSNGPPTKNKRSSEGKRQAVDLTSPSPAKKRRKSHRNELKQEPSNIPQTSFTSSSAGSSCGYRKGTEFKGSSQGDKKDIIDGEDPFYISGSQKLKKAKRLYGRKSALNIYKQAPTEPEDTLVEGGKTVKTGPKGYRTVPMVNSEILSKISRTPEDKHKKGFKAPASYSPSPRSKRVSRRSGVVLEEASEQSAFKQPPLAPSPAIEKPPPKFTVPPSRPSSPERRRVTRSRHTNESKGPLPQNPDLQQVKDMRCLADTMQARLNVQLEPPTSSATMSSGPSFDLELSDDSPLSSPLISVPDEESDNSRTKNHPPKDHPPVSHESKCPICKSLVPRLFMEEFLGSRPANTRQQARFCRAHKIRSAENEWKTRGYPTIKWHHFERTLSKYESAIGEILHGRSKSFYRNVLEDQIKSGVNRTLRQGLLSGSGWEGLCMGYYGSKGARVMLEYVTSEFAKQTRRRAESDRLISASGVSGFIQAVLAPELVVMLVKDDMKVDDEHARAILRDSADVGNLLNEEEDEFIKDVEENKPDVEALQA